MTRTVIFTTEAPKPPAAYSQAVKAAGLIFVSGTGPFDPDRRGGRGGHWKADRPVLSQHLSNSSSSG